MHVCWCTLGALLKTLPTRKKFYPNHFQEPRKGGFSKGGFLQETGVTPKKPKLCQGIWTSNTFGTQSATVTRGVYVCKTPLLKTPFSWFLIFLKLPFPDLSFSELIRSGKLQNESFPNFSIFRPEFCTEFCSEFSPNFSRTSRASFRGRRRPEKMHQNPHHYSMQNSQAKHEKNIHKILLESRQFAAK